jgi:hypothetical protein
LLHEFIYLYNIYIKKFLCLVGITWTPQQREIIETESPFNLTVCKMSLNFKFLYECDDCFPRAENPNRWVEIAIYSNPNQSFQAEPLSLTFDNVDFNRFELPSSENVSINK